jgi:hypothetical protein
MKHPISLSLSESERASLHTFIHAGKANARTLTCARVLRHPPTRAGPTSKSARPSTSVAIPRSVYGNCTQDRRVRGRAA